MDQPWVHICPLPLEPPVSHLSPPLLVAMEPWCEFPESYSKFPMAIYFTYGNVCFHVTFSIHPTISFLPPINKFFLSFFFKINLPMTPSFTTYLLCDLEKRTSPLWAWVWFTGHWLCSRTEDTEVGKADKHPCLPGADIFVRWSWEKTNRCVI